jgi:hypothetical protein
VNQPAVALGTRLIFVCLGLFGAAFAVTGLLTNLPTPAAGGTCGPGQGSEAAIIALVDPITIGAGPEPPATNPSGRAQWSSFVHECQTAADDRALVAFPILLASAAVAVVGPLAWRKRSHRPTDATPERISGAWSQWSSPSVGEHPLALSRTSSGASDPLHPAPAVPPASPPDLTEPGAP